MSPAPGTGPAEELVPLLRSAVRMIYPARSSPQFLPESAGEVAAHLVEIVVSVERLTGLPQLVGM